MAAHEQVQGFLRFFAGKRDGTISELASLFEEVKDLRMMEDMYSRDEVEALLDSLVGAVQDTSRRDLEKTALMAALVVEQIIHQAKREGVEVEVDMSKTEDESLLADVGKVRTDEIGKVDEGMRRGVKLDSLRDEQEKLVGETERLKEENTRLQDRNKTVMSQATAALKEKSKLSEELLEAQAEIARLEAAHGAAEGKASEAADAVGDVAELRLRLSRAEADLGETRAALEEAKAEQDKALNQSKQFVSLKKMLATKNAQLNDLRKRMLKYEPDDTPMDDDSGAGRK